MKKSIPTIIASLLLLCLCFAFFFQNKRKGETLLSIKDTKPIYTYKASFYPGATPEVTRYLDSCADGLTKANARFHIKITEGNLAITADKNDNSVFAIAGIRKMCRGISDILIQN